MTANEMQYEFFLRFDKAFEYAAPAYDDKQVSKVLSDAQFHLQSL